MLCSAKNNTFVILVLPSALAVFLWAAFNGYFIRSQAAETRD